MKLLVRRAGFLTTVQDLGRTGYRASGVPLSGALDAHALRIANLVVGNDETAAGLELTLGKVRLGFQDERVIAWGGGPFTVQLGEKEIRSGRPAFVERGEELVLTAPPNGARAWLAISGGIDVPLVLGSRSTDLRSGFGGLAGRALRDGDELQLGRSPIRRPQPNGWCAPNEWSNTRAAHRFLRVIRGTHWSDALPRAAFTVTPDSDRMGVRLAGAALPRATERDLLSEAVAPGTIQLPPNGEPILLLGDCQTIGGYPKIAHVITVDLPGAAQLRPGDAVRFVEVSLPEAQTLLQERERDVAFFRAALELRWS
jgi:antagonist of KipI